MMNLQLSEELHISATFNEPALMIIVTVVTVGVLVWSELLQETSTPALDFDTHQNYMVKQVSMRVTARAYYLKAYCEPLQV